MRGVGRGGAWAWGERVWSLDVLTFDEEERNGGSGNGRASGCSVNFGFIGVIRTPS